MRSTLFSLLQSFSLIVTILLLLPNQGLSQNRDRCWNFNQLCLSEQPLNEVYEACFPGWIATHGTPHQGGDPLDNGTIVMVSGTNICGFRTVFNGEGVALNYPIREECLFEFSFDYIVETSNSLVPFLIELYPLVSPLPNNNSFGSNCNSNLPNIVLGDPIWSIRTDQLNDNAASVAPQANMLGNENQFWFRITPLSTNKGTCIFTLDNFCIDNLGKCTKQDLLIDKATASSNDCSIVSVDARVSNAGSGSMNNVALEVYLSTNTTLDDNDDLLTLTGSNATTYSFGTLAGNSLSSLVNYDLDLPAGITPGDYHLIFRVLPLQGDDEPSNNYAVVPISINGLNCGPAHDLFVNNTYISNGTGPGESCFRRKVGFWVRNLGNAPVNNVEVRVYMSEDNILDSSDELLVRADNGQSVFQYGTLTPGQTINFSGGTLMDLPNVSADNRKILFHATPTGGDIDVANNLAVKEVSFIINGENCGPNYDLFVNNSYISNGAGPDENCFRREIGFWVRNLGNTAVANVEVRVYMSEDNVLDINNDALLTRVDNGASVFNFGTLDPGETINFSEGVLMNLPSVFAFSRFIFFHATPTTGDINVPNNTSVKQVFFPLGCFIRPGTGGSGPKDYAAELSVSLTPNPARHEVLITYDQLTNNGIGRVLDLNGKVWETFSLKAGTGSQRMDAIDLPAGIYIVNISNADQVSTQRLVIQK